MAEAILFGHRSLQPLIDLGRRLRKAVGKASGSVPRAPIESVLDFESAPMLSASRRHRRRDDRHGPEDDGRPRSRSPRSRSRGTRSSTAGRLRRSGRPIVGNQMHGITNDDIRGAPSPAEAAAGHSTLPATRSSSVTASGSTSRSSRRRTGDGTEIEPGRISTRWSSPARATGSRELPAPDAVELFGVDLTTARCATPRRPPTCCCGSRTTCRAACAALRESIADAVRANRTGGDTNALLEQARRNARVSKGLFSLIQKKTVRRAVSTRGSDRRPRAHRHPADLGRGRADPARTRLRPVHPR